MGEKRNSKRGWKGAVLGFFLSLMAIFSGVTGVLNTEAVYAEPETGVTTTVTTEAGTTATGTTGTIVATGEAATGAGATTGGAATSETAETTEEKKETVTGDECQNALGSIGWIVCPTTGKIAEAVDWLYDKIEGILQVDPIEARDGTPIYEIWKYCRGVTNVVFIIFLLIVIYSQITGVGISNYGIKKALPKLIIVAVLVNLSFLLCSLAVDVSNIVGNSLREVFKGVQESAVLGMVADGSAVTSAELTISQANLYSALAGGTALTIGGAVIAFETGAIWMLIPVLLGAIVSVATGLITIAMRQAVVALLIMIAPLAIVAYMLPNTEGWFKKWKDLLMRMLVFYPMFSVLFGASQLAGFAIVASAKDGFGVLLGVAVEIFPLFFSWKMMKMSGTVLGTINDSMNRLAATPLATNRAWADSHRQATKANYLASERAVTPSLRLRQFLSNRKIDRETETAEKNELIKNRGLAYRARLNYDERGVPTRRGEEAYGDLARTMEYQRAIERDKNNLNKGLGQLEAINEAARDRSLSAVERARLNATRARLNALDTRVVNAADYLKVEKARGEKIEYENAAGFHRRLEAAVNAHFDDENGYIVDVDGVRRRNAKYKLHMEPGSNDFSVAMERYGEIRDIMEGNVMDAQFAAATAARSYDTQKKMIETAYQKYFELTPPTKDVEYRLGELTKMDNAAKYIDTIIPGLRILNQRGDTDLTLEQINNILNGEGGVQLGTHASQALASFLMFEVKDNDPFMRRFGKYINLETANAFNKNTRQDVNVTYGEYIRGYHQEPNGEIMYAKRGMRELVEGTSLDNIERTAMSNLDTSLKMAYTDEEGKLDTDKYLRKREEVEVAMGPQVISASLKYLSGSEQLKSMVKFKTGFDYKQKKEEYVDEHGVRRERVVTDENGDPVYIWEPIWAKDRTDFADEDKEKVQKYFEGKTLQYLLDQTPTQILGLRSDYYAPLTEHLAHAYEMNDEMRGWSEEAMEERRAYMAELAEIQTRYGDLSPEEAERRREEDKAALRKSRAKAWAGAEFRQVLDSKGKLNQIYRTRRSGAANNAKDWVRDWLGLDNEIAITKKLDDDRKRLKREYEEERRREGAPVDEAGGDAAPVYSEADRMAFVTQVDDLWQDYRDENDEVFYEKSLEFVKETLGEGSFIAKQYEKFREDDPSADSYTLREVLKDLLSEEGNY